MLEDLIASYISTLHENHVMEYAKKRGIFLEPQEAVEITSFLKRYWKALYHQQTTCLKELKGKVKEETYTKALLLYEEMRKNYL